jgi:hypothetical protein
MLSADKGGWLFGARTLRPPALGGRIAVIPVLLSAISGCAWDGMVSSVACRIFAAMTNCWFAFQHPGGADEPNQEFI